MYLVQILLPIYDNNGNPFENIKFKKVKKTLTDAFGGLTSYIRAPAEGFWKDDDKQTVKDEVILFEVMIEKIAPHWWETYKKELQDEFEQEEIIVRATKISLL